MQFYEGQIVVHPQHGPARVTAVNERLVKGEPVPYLEFRVLGVELDVSVPVDRAEYIGVREPLSADEFDELFVVLRAAGEKIEAMWSRRIKANQAKLASGEILPAAEVVRDLTRYSEEKKLSLAERGMLSYAKGPIAAEMAVVLDIPVEHAEAMIDHVIGSEEPFDWAAAQARRGEFAVALAA
jgi:CarD family transcriptional regulator